MMPCYSIFFQSFVKPFYKENAGTFLFLIILLFCIIGKVDGAELFEYHLSLATGILQNFSFLLLVLLAWLVYTRKFVVFVAKVIQHPQYSFLQVYNQLSRAKRFRLFFVIEGWLFLPVILYSLFLFYVTLGMHTYLSMAVIGLYLLISSIVAALWHIRLLGNVSIETISKQTGLFTQWNGPASYKLVLLHFVARRQPVFWAGIKLFTCGLLYLIARNNQVGNYDAGMAFIFYTFGILANGVLIFRIRAFEEMYLSFYRGLAVPLLKRLLNYCFIYALLLVPECCTILLLYPVHLSGADTAGFIVSGFSMVLFIHTLTFMDDFTMKEYLKILFTIFFVNCLCFPALGLFFLTALFAVSAVIMFMKGYYTFERKQKT